MSSETHEIVPDDVDRAELQRRIHEGAPAAEEASDRCPECGYAKLAVRTNRHETTPGDFYCRNCRSHIDEPVVATSIQAALEKHE